MPGVPSAGPELRPGGTGNGGKWKQERKSLNTRRGERNAEARGRAKQDPPWHSTFRMSGRRWAALPDSRGHLQDQDLGAGPRGGGEEGWQMSPMGTRERGGVERGLE